MENTDVRGNYLKLKQEFENQQDMMKKMQDTMMNMRNNLQRQSNYCACLGAVLGSLLWKATRQPSVTAVLISGNGFEDFLSILSAALASFVETYETDLPPDTTDESRFVISVCAIYTNLAATPEGRQFLMDQPKGREVLQQFIAVLPTVPCPSGNSLMKLLLMGLYNMTISPAGLVYLKEQDDIFIAIRHSLHHSTSDEVKITSLRLLKALSHEVRSKSLYNLIQQTIPSDRLKDLSKSGTMDIKMYSQEVIENLNAARSDLNEPPQPPPVAKRSCPCPGTTRFCDQTIRKLA